MAIGYRWSWGSVVHFDKTAVSPQMFTAIMVKPLTSALWLRAGRRAWAQKYCQPVRHSDPLRSDILNGLRASYIGDSNSLTLNGPLPTVKFIVEDLAPRKIMLTFWQGDGR